MATSVSEQVEQQEAAASQPQMELPTESIEPTAKIDNSLNATDFIPKLAEKPESKPLYDSVRQVKTFERLAACIDGGKSGCTCYSDQGTALKEVTKAMCKDYVKNGMPFNPYKDPSTTAQAAPAPQSPTTTESNQILTMGGKSPQNLMYDGYVEAGAQFQQRGGIVGTN